MDMDMDKLQHSQLHMLDIHKKQSLQAGMCKLLARVLSFAVVND